jgi:hypothetical protein
MSFAEFALVCQLEALIGDKSTIGAAGTRGGNRYSRAESKSLPHEPVVVPILGTGRSKNSPHQGPLALFEPSSRFSAFQLGLPTELFLGILSTSSGSARSISRRAIRSINVAVVRPRRSASIAAVSTFWAKPSRLPGNAITVPYRRCEMKNPTFVAELHKKLGAPSSETVESLRLLKAFLKLAPTQRSEVIELVERLVIDAQAAPDHPLS